MGLFNEKDLGDFLFQPENFCQYILGDDIKCYKSFKTYRQVQMGSYGVADLVAIYDYDDLDEDDIPNKRTYINIVELKITENSSYNELGQLCRYMTGIEKYLENKGVLDQYEICGYLICPSIAMSSDFTLMLNYIKSDIEILTFDLSLKSGIEFTHHSLNGWHIRECGDLDKNLDLIFPKGGKNAQQDNKRNDPNKP